MRTWYPPELKSGRGVKLFHETDDNLVVKANLHDDEYVCLFELGYDGLSL